ncbi:DUF2155 domain-containing protein [Novosphingobium sp. FSY-8]|uniref:DUF2155 domain-containing protein n=2 Tax=Novosphingobium ovatum TaxID=1908523 RepID=A0ABW9X929_9SPHN|nr:DUF2155 domain-containing protein [Novosphingobium ovatum]
MPLSLMALAGCGGGDGADSSSSDVPQAVGSVGPAPSGLVESEFGTPVKDRVATLGLLNKRNNETTELKMKPGEARRIGNVVVKLSSCERSLPWERPQQTGAFVQLFVEERASVSEPLRWRKVFSGWLFKESPSLNVVEHPVYDVWVKDCAMSFPGEEEKPEDFAAAKRAPKASGSDSAPASQDAPAPQAPAAPAAPD